MYKGTFIPSDNMSFLNSIIWLQSTGAVTSESNNKYFTLIYLCILFKKNICTICFSDILQSCPSFYEE